MPAVTQTLHLRTPSLDCCATGFSEPSSSSDVSSTLLSNPTTHPDAADQQPHTSTVLKQGSHTTSATHPQLAVQIPECTVLASSSQSPINDGWVYATAFTGGVEWHPWDSKMNRSVHLARRRLWIRKRLLVDDARHLYRISMRRAEHVMAKAFQEQTTDEQLPTSQPTPRDHGSPTVSPMTPVLATMSQSRFASSPVVPEFLQAVFSHFTPCCIPTNLQQFLCAEIPPDLCPPSIVLQSYLDKCLQGLSPVVTSFASSLDSSDPTQSAATPSSTASSFATLFSTDASFTSSRSAQSFSPLTKGPRAQDVRRKSCENVTTVPGFMLQPLTSKTAYAFGTSGQLNSLSINTGTSNPPGSAPSQHLATISAGAPLPPTSKDICPDCSGIFGAHKSTCICVPIQCVCGLWYPANTLANHQLNCMQ
eukprot:gene6424-1144_t